MRFMIIVKGSKESEAGQMPRQEVFDAMAVYHEELAKAGVLLDGNGLKPSASGWRIKWSGGKKTVIDGPFAEGRELVAGFTIIEVKSVEEAREWARRFPNPGNEDGEIEVRQFYELEELGGTEEWNQRLRQTGIGDWK